MHPQNENDIDTFNISVEEGTPPNKNKHFFVRRLRLLIVFVLCLFFVAVVEYLPQFFKKPETSISTEVKVSSEEVSSRFTVYDGVVYEGKVSNQKIIEGADPKTFQEVFDGNGAHTGFFKDANAVYYRYQEGIKPIEGSNGSTFTVLNSLYAKDSDNVYYYAGKPLVYNVFKMEEADPGSFEAFGKIEFREGRFMGNPYSKDREKVFYYNHLIEDADPDSFEVLSLRYTKDENRVYYLSQVLHVSTPEKLIPLNEVDPASFRVITLGDEYEHYTADKNYVYLDNQVIGGADPSTFQLLNDSVWGIYAKDANNIFFGNQIVNSVDRDSFEVMNGFYAKDKNNVYFLGKVLAEADTQTFEPIANSEEIGYEIPRIGKDKNTVFFNGEPIERADSISFTFIRYTYLKDANYVYKIDREDEVPSISVVEGASVSECSASNLCACGDLARCCLEE